MKRLLFSFALLMGVYSYSQKHEFLDIPKLSEEDVKSTKSAKFEDAPAEILYQSTHFRIDYDWSMTKNIVKRVKIYNKDNAADFLNHEIGIYDNRGGTRETLSNLKANTYNFENGKVVATKIERNEKFKSKENKYYDMTKFAFANVKDGSVIEYSYSIITPFLTSTPRVLIENEIPARYVEFVLDTPKPLGYTINYKGNLTPNQRVVEEKTLYGNDYQTYRFGYQNIPPYKEEKYVGNNDNYKTGIKAELNSTLINNIFKSYANSWEDIRKRLYEYEDFGQELKKQHLVKAVLPEEIKSMGNTMQKADAILKFVQKNYTWNKEDDVVTDKGIKNLLSTKIGNSAEINFLIIMLLRSADINADPVVLSTVNKGLLLSYNPSIAQLNYVLASFVDNNQIYLLDGASKQTEINMISPKALNYYGLIMGKDQVKQINVVYPDVSKTFLTVDAKMNADGTFEGHFADRDTKLYAMMVNERYTDDKEKFSKEYKDEYKFSFANLKSGLQDNHDFETSFDFTADTFVDVIGSKLVFNPLLFLYSQNHNYTQKEARKAPLEFYSANERTKKVVISLPDGYAFENVPKSKKFRTEDNGLSYSYLVTQEGNKLTVETSVKIDDSSFPKEYYPAFTQIFDNITKQEAQVVTAVKK